MAFRPPNPKGGRPQTKPDDRLFVKLRGTAVEFMSSVSKGRAREYALYGPRGEGKTVTVLTAMVGHAGEHKEAGYELPVRWIGVTDTLTSHKLKTLRTLEQPFWGSMWKIHDGGKLAVAIVNKQEVVKLDLFGIEDLGAMDRVRMETVGVWFEEPAPAALMVQSSGVSETAWDIAFTSQRMPTHCYPAIMSLNYPDEDHWTWTRFSPPTLEKENTERIGFHPGDNTRMWFQIPPGERSSEKEREAWAYALRERPDLLRRLLEGKPGVVILGKQVADGFSEDVHVSRETLRAAEGEPLFVGQDFGHTPATTIGQMWRGFIRVLAALPCERGGVKQHIENSVIPWIMNNAPWALRTGRTMIRGCYDVSGETGEQTDIDQNPIGTLESLLPGLWAPGPVKWEARRHALLSVFNKHASPGVVALQLCPIGARPLIKALSGRWYYAQGRDGRVSRDVPKKPNHPWDDLGDSFIYFLDQVLQTADPIQEVKIESAFALD